MAGMTACAAGMAARAVRVLAVLAPVLAAPDAAAEKLANPIAVFAGLDKITGAITTFEVPVNGRKRFGALEVAPRVCYSRPITEQPKTTTFVEVEERLHDGKARRIFTGWMFAESPGLNAVEHPVYDVWLSGCRDPSAAPPEKEGPAELPEHQLNIPKDND
jgi:hypothetical protein